MKKIVLTFCCGLFVVVSSPVAAEQGSGTIERAQGEQLASAIGHYSRAKALLAAAVREFDKGRNIADPSALINPDQWRDTLLDRSVDLEKVLAPQPRATKGGLRFEPDRRLN